MFFRDINKNVKIIEKYVKVIIDILKEDYNI